MSISLRGLWKIGFKAATWLFGAQHQINSGSTFHSIHAELYRNEKWAVLIEIRQLSDEEKKE